MTTKISSAMILHPMQDSFLKVSREMYDKTYRMNLGVHAQKMLYALASASCAVSDKNEQFNECLIPIDNFFEYLNLKPENNARYEIVRQSVNEIMKNPLEYRNGKKWGYYSWFTVVECNNSHVRIKFDDAIRPFLLGLTEYCLLESKYYTPLSTAYGMWLYPYLRNVANMKISKLTLTLDEIRLLTHNEEKPSYDPKQSKNANADLLKRIIGITSSKSNGQRRWVITPNGTLDEINKQTDLIIEVDVNKLGKQFHSVTFYVFFKAHTFQGKRKQIRRIRRTDYKDNKYSERIEEVKQLSFFQDDKPRISKKDFEEHAKAARVPFFRFLEIAGYELTGDGKTVVKKD